MCKSSGHVVPDLIAFGAGAVEEVGATALLQMLGAGPFDLAGSLAFIFNYLPVALGACPLDTRRGGECLFVSTVALMEDSGYRGVKNFVAKFAR